MKCMKCRGEMRQDTTTFVVDKDNCCIVVRSVPCLQCEACGEVVYTGEVAANLEKIVGAARKALTEVAIVKYPESVA